MKITLTDLSNLQNENTAVAAINANNAILETALENTLSRDGTSPNQMGSTFDMNSNRIINLPAPISASEPLRYQDLSTFVGGGTVSNIPSAGNAQSVLTKNSATNYDYGWSLYSLVGTTGTTITFQGTDTYVGRATVDTLTHKTFDTAGTGNVLKINGTTVSAITGTGSVVLSTSPTLVTPILGTPTSGTLTSCTGLPISTGVSGLAAGIATFLTTPTSANLRAALTDETGTGAAYFVGGALGTPSSATLTNATGLPLSGLTTQAAFSLVGNFTGSSAVPTASAIGSLTQKVSPATTDLVLIQDQAASGALKYALLSSLPSSTGVTSIASNTGAFTLSNGITNSTNDLRIDIGNLPGTSSGSGAAAGKVGEVITSGSVTTGSMTSGTPINVTSITLTAGDWDISAYVAFGTAAGTSTTDWYAAISLTTASLVAVSGSLLYHERHAAITDNSDVAFFPPVQVLPGGSTTYYLNSQWIGSSTAPTTTGILRARRMR